MKQTVIPTVVTGAIVALLAVASFRPVNPAKENEQQLLARANEFNMLFPQEKVYLHLDRPSYWAGEDIWFKAYLKGSPTQTGNLYVELINAKGQVIYKNTCWVQGGLSYGDLHLADTISSGMYQVRAYTNWMRNFDEDQFFRRDLVIWNLRDKNQKAEPIQLKSREIDFQFMPEGGVFLAGVENRLAFKVTDRSGKGLFAEGVVTDDKGTEVATIKSGYKGMGSFAMTPKPGAKYTAKMTIAGNISQTIELPVATATGVAMKINSEDTSRIQLEVNEAGAATSGKCTVVGQREGNVCYRGEIATAAGKGQLAIDKSKFPTGIVRLTLFDANMLPRCERLVFVNHHDQVEVKIEPAEEAFHPRGKVTLDLYAMSKDEIPAMANLSLSVYHTETNLETETYPDNILTRFLISSELKGKIEEPGYYFKDDSASTILALDNLLLTHGYRYFEWKAIAEDKKPKLDFEPESGIELRGTAVSAVLHKAPLKNGNVTMLEKTTRIMLWETLTDSTGRFAFQNLLFFDTLHVVLKARPEKEEKDAEIWVEKPRLKTLDTKILPLTYRYKVEDKPSATSYISEINPELLNKKWHLSDTILLRDVNVMARKRKAEDVHTRPYLEADYVIDVAANKDLYFDIDQLKMNSAMFRSFWDKKAPVFFDGLLSLFPRDEDDLGYPFSWIDKIELVRMAPIPGKPFGPAIYIYLKRGVPNEKVPLSTGNPPIELIGYSVVRNFYSPVYDSPEDKQKAKNDFRSTLYWNPTVETDEEGLGWVEFYNSDQTGEVKVVVEGISKDGKLCRGEYRYSVTK